jgi:hypothetical protein
MASSSDAPVDLYIAAYDDPDDARGHWDAIKQLAHDDVIKVDGLILVSRRSDGKIHVEPDSSGIVAIVEGRWIEDVEKALSNASKRHRECDKRREHGQELRRRQHIEVRLKVK